MLGDMFDNNDMRGRRMLSIETATPGIVFI